MAALMASVAHPEYLDEAVDLYDLIEIAEDLGLKSRREPVDPAVLDTLRWRLDQPVPARADLSTAA